MNLDKIAFWFWFVGFFVAFMPLYILGFMERPAGWITTPSFNGKATPLYYLKHWVSHHLLRGSLQICHIVIGIERKKIEIQQEIPGMVGHWSGRLLHPRLSIILR